MKIITQIFLVVLMGIGSSCILMRYHEEHNPAKPVEVTNGVAEHFFVLDTRESEFWIEFVDRRGNHLNDATLKKLTVEVMNRSQERVMLPGIVLAPGESSIIPSKVEIDGVQHYSRMFTVAGWGNDVDIKLNVIIREEVSGTPSVIGIVTDFQDGM